MKAISHKLTHVFQPTNNTCGYAALTMLMSHYGVKTTVDELLKEVPQPKNDAGETSGSVTAQLVTWVNRQGFATHMYTSEAEVIDLTWQDKSEKQLVAKLKSARGKKVAPVFGKHWTTVYIDAYLEMLKSGSKLTVVHLIRASLIYELLQKGPVFVNICSTVAVGNGRRKSVGIRKSVSDDIKGNISNHSIVVYGNDKDGNFLVADPWDGMIVMDPEKLVISIAAAQIECDNQIFVIEK